MQFLTGEGGLAQSGVFQPGLGQAAVIGDVNRIVGQSGSFGVVGAFPNDREFRFQTHRRQWIDGDLRHAGVDGVENRGRVDRLVGVEDDTCLGVYSIAAGRCRHGKCGVPHKPLPFRRAEIGR